MTKSACARTSSCESARSTPSSRKALLGDERVVRDDAHLQTGGAPRDLLADAAEAEHAQRLVRQLEPAVAGALPAPLLQSGVRLRDVPREREQQADRVLGRRDDGGLGRVGDHDPAARGGLDVDVVHPHARAPDHLQPVGPLDQVGGELRRRADDDRVVLADPLGEIAVRVDVDVEPLAQELDSGVGDLLADEDPGPHAGTPANRSAAATTRTTSAPKAASRGSGTPVSTAETRAETARA